MLQRIQCLLMVIITSIMAFNLSIQSQQLTPFTLPWNDGSESITNVSSLLEKPAGKHGFVHTDENGRMVDGEGKRIRFLGMNTSFSGGFPPKDIAEGVASRLAKYGINCVRIHHHDSLRAPNGVWKEGTSDKQQLDPDVIDRLDYFISELKKNGIYVNLNLKVGREVINGDGFEQTDRLPTYDKGPDHFVPRMIELQKEFASDYLGRTNPYTGLRYVDDPVVALVEINNEAGLLNAWRNNDLDNTPESYMAYLQNDWNEFLQGRYSNTDALRAAWQAPSAGSGEEKLTRGLAGWNLQQAENGKGTKTIANDGPDGDSAMNVEVTQVGDQSWYVQLIYSGLNIEPEKVYKADLWMKASRPRTVDIGIRQNHDPWQFLDSTLSANLTREWQRFEFLFSSGQGDSNARMDITGFGGQLGSISASRISLTESSFDGLPQGETLEDGSVAWMRRDIFARRTVQAKRDWYEFLVERETQYNQEMHDYLRNDLGVKSLITGSQMGFSTLLSQLPHDYIDDHAYWRHPSFPNNSWDSVDWVIQNDSIVDTLDNSLLHMMQSRIEGRPYTVSEYNHPSPNVYASEGVPLLAAYAAFQDWDGIFYYSYSHNTNYPDRSIDSFFDFTGNTPKMMCMPIAANLLLRGDIEIGRDPVIGILQKETYLDHIFDRNGSLWTRPLLDTDVNAFAPYTHRTAVRVVDEAQTIENPETSTSTVLLETDTEEIQFRKKGVNAYYQLMADQTKGFIGFNPGRLIDLQDGVVLTVGDTVQNWANVLLSLMKSDNEGDHWLLMATGYSENKGMVWKDETKTSVGNQWGDGPPLIETVPLRIEWERPGVEAKIYALDEQGQRAGEVENATKDIDGGFAIDLMNGPLAPWYEIVIFDPSEVREAGLHN
ncbi:MAG: carbohydrate binding domain-containing protein [Candidatus Hinthialibacter antarcticus]|nr:carbohydrate binding domain-containing protein [Candidatus Hinthialibacter antarcticus]